MRWPALFGLLAALGCGDGAGAPAGDASVDAGEPRPDPVEACSAGDCWETELAIPLCTTATYEEDFSSGLYNAHRYAAILLDRTPTRIVLRRTGGDWTPALVLRDVEGTTIFDGRVGLQSEELTATGSPPGDTVTLDVVSGRTRGVEIIVTGQSSLDSEFVERVATDATYSLTATGDCGVSPVDCSVNGHAVEEPACGWLHFTARRVVPRLGGAREERLTAAARVAWWSLKEGVLFLRNPIVYSNCSVEGAGDVRIGPLETCEPGRAWQVGLAGMQAGYLDTSAVEATSALLYPGEEIDEVLERAATQAGLGSEEAAQIVAGSDDLRRSWLLRDSAIGFHQQAPVVTGECVDDSLSWCYGTGWPATAMFAPDRDSALRAMDDVRALLDQLAP